MAIFFVSDESIKLYTILERCAKDQEGLTGKAFDDILTSDHGASQHGTLAMRNKIEKQDFRSVHGEMVQASSSYMNLKEIGFTNAPILLSPTQLHLCNQETFLFYIDHQRYEAHFKESFQVQETISGSHTWAWASDFNIDKDWRHRSYAIQSCL